MIYLGRVTALIGTVGAVALFAVMAAGHGGSAGAPNLVDYSGALVAISMFGSWALAIWHWGRRYPNDRSSKGLWGAAVVFGFVIGAAAYWFWGADPSDAATSAEP